MINSQYGDQPGITRLDGKGVGSMEFLRIANRASVEEQMLAGTNVGRIDYLPGNAPIGVKVVDPLRVPSGTYRLSVGDKDYKWGQDSATGAYMAMRDTGAGPVLTDSVYWALTDVDDPTVLWTSFQTIEENYEQFIPDLGISIVAQRVPAPSGQGEANIGETSGYIGVELEYRDSSSLINWYEGVEDDEGVFDMIKNSGGEDEANFDPLQEFSNSAGGWYPFMLSDGELRPESYYFSIMNINSPGSRFRNTSSTIGGKVRDTMLVALNNVNVVFTADTSKWSRCMVTESATRYYSSGFVDVDIPSRRRQMEWRGSNKQPAYPSRNKDMSIDSSSNGMSWFPGYAYDVETGQRLNIFFGENSVYNGDIIEERVNEGVSTGNDMIFNPTSTRQVGFSFFDQRVQYLSSVLGGQHIIYVSRTPYDSCRVLLDQLTSIFIPVFQPDNNIVPGMDVTWGSIALLAPGTQMGGANGELPPSEMTVKLRVNRPFEKEEGTNENEGYPLYEFSLNGFEPTKEEQSVAESALDLLRVVPNPYYAYSDYEVTEIDNVI